MDVPYVVPGPLADPERSAGRAAWGVLSLVTSFAQAKKVTPRGERAIYAKREKPSRKATKPLPSRIWLKADAKTDTDFVAPH
ncbi:hypothetical protein, partial [Pseudoxanthomonas mexicana]|uniref:hypothetical protein n=1 Tax=Pseudoxanthomonas mexicana TaxID=128785 RepID=UPI001EE4279A